MYCSDSCSYYLKVGNIPYCCISLNPITKNISCEKDSLNNIVLRYISKVYVRGMSSYALALLLHDRFQGSKIFFSEFHEEKFQFYYCKIGSFYYDKFGKHEFSEDSPLEEYSSDNSTSSIVRRVLS